MRSTRKRRWMERKNMRVFEAHARQVHFSLCACAVYTNARKQHYSGAIVLWQTFPSPLQGLHRLIVCKSANEVYNTTRNPPLVLPIAPGGEKMGLKSALSLLRRRSGPDGVCRSRCHRRLHRPRRCRRSCRRRAPWRRSACAGESPRPRRPSRRRPPAPD